MIDETLVYNRIFQGKENANNMFISKDRYIEQQYWRGVKDGYGECLRIIKDEVNRKSEQKQSKEPTCVEGVNNR